jgi:lambda family phage portal protein
MDAEGGFAVAWLLGSAEETVLEGRLFDAAGNPRTGILHMSRRHTDAVGWRPRRAEDGLSVPLQVQVLEPELCPHYSTTTAPNGNRIRAGIEFNGLGQRVAYWMYRARPGELEDYDYSTLRRVPADTVIHLFNPLRPGQIRGLPHLTQGLIKLLELDKFDDATLLRQQLGNMLVGFITKNGSAESGINPFTGMAPSDTDEEGRDVIKWEPGLWHELDEGEDVRFSEPPDVSSSYADFMRQQLFAISAAVDVPYEVLTGDMSKVNDRTVRVILNEFRRRVMAYQHQIIAFQLCRPVWRAWLDRAFLSGALPLPIEYIENTEPWARVKWMPQGWPYLHPVQDVQANERAIRAGFTTRSAVVSEQGEDAAAVDREQAADNQRADDLGLQYTSDGRTGSEPNDAAPEPEPARETEGAPA